MSARPTPNGPLDDLLDALADDVLCLDDNEVREEAGPASESLAADSARFGRALYGARALLRLREQQPSEGAAVLPGRGFGVRTIADRHGQSRWKSRAVRRYGGRIGALLDMLPEFDSAPFRAHPDMREHPDLRMVVRRPMPHLPARAVGVVSRNYRLVQHRAAVRMCLRGLAAAGLDDAELRGELALSDLGEWMGFTFLLPSAFAFRDPYGHEVEFRCDVSNSVDGSARLSVRFDWFRLVCSNGMIMREERHESRQHRGNLQLDKVEERMFEGFEDAVRTRALLEAWTQFRVGGPALRRWVDEPLTRAWSLYAAGRVYHICVSGLDARFRGGATGTASGDLPAQVNPDTCRRVPGSPPCAQTGYDVAQAMSWVASRQTNLVERFRRQRQIPALLERLRAA